MALNKHNIEVDDIKVGDTVTVTFVVKEVCSNRFVSTETYTGDYETRSWAAKDDITAVERQVEVVVGTKFPHSYGYEPWEVLAIDDGLAWCRRLKIHQTYHVTMIKERLKHV